MWGGSSLSGFGRGENCADREGPVVDLNEVHI